MEEVLSKSYKPEEIEKRCYDFWVQKGYFKAESSSHKPPFSIVIPPPNVTGSLHMGHALNNTIQDILARYKRMDGYNVLWLPGTDHAGIATQNVVEKLIAKEGLTRHLLGRKAFIERVWKWKAESGNTIINQLKRLGASCDWSRERFTMDEGLSKAVKKVFLSLFNEGLIQRDNRLINWCPRCGTALSDLEVEYEEKDGNLYYIKYPVVGESDSYIMVATTRPETMLGDTAVAVHPDDKRHKELIGKKLSLPLTKREIPVIADTMVDTAFGTGAVKVTPAHDFADEAVGRRHNLPFISVIDREGVMNGDIPEEFKGLNRFDARKKICEALKEKELLVKIEPIKHNVGHCYRCKEITEPLLTLQWFVRVKTLAEKAIDAVKQKRIKLIPEQWENTYFNWMENIQDWCISRQIWWGHQIPVFYCPNCDGDKILITLKENQKDTKRLCGTYNDFVAEGLSFDKIIEDIDYYLILEGATPIPEGGHCSRCKNSSLIQDPDVLDTWFSSALWPFSTLGWPDDTEDLKTFYPTNTLVTGFDILFFWVARMAMMGLKFMNDVPFRDVYIHALVRDSKGQKMSKSKGNVIDPLTIIDKFGADAFRFTLTALAAQGRDVKLSEARIEGYKHFVNKLWNASRFVLMNIQDYDVPKEFNINPNNLQPFDNWILTRLNETVADVRNYYDSYNFNDAANAIYKFWWNDFCDWYIEHSKLRANEEIVKYLLWHCLIATLKLLHPIMPFVTEEIFQKIPHFDESIMIAPFPIANIAFIGKDVSNIELFIKVVRTIRNVKSEMNISPLQKADVTIVVKDDVLADFLKMMKEFIEMFARANVTFKEVLHERPSQSALAVVEGIDIWVNLQGLINVEDEKNRIAKEIKKTQKDVEFLTKRLANEDYLRNAPEDVVEEDKQKLGDFKEKLAKLMDNLEFLKGLK